MLSVESLDLSYGASRVLRGVDLRAEIGEVTCVLGRNGVGKTSLLRAIVGQRAVGRGRILWQGRDITRSPAWARAAAGVAYVPQGREIFPLLTVEENLRTGFAALPRRQRALPDRIFELFPVLRRMMGRRGGDLSGGQQQQLAIARALVMRPRLLVLDEPTEGIQPSVVKDIERAIRTLREGGDMAILLVEQYFEFAQRLADRFAVLNRGEVVASGAADRLGDENVRRYLTV